METSPNQQPILCRTCARYALERYKMAQRWEEGQRCVAGVRFAGERTECVYFVREPGSDDE